MTTLSAVLWAIAAVLLSLRAAGIVTAGRLDLGWLGLAAAAWAVLLGAA